MKKRWLLVLGFLLIFFNIALLFSVNKPDKTTVTTFTRFLTSIVGYVSNIGRVFFIVLRTFTITILSPENTTYNFTALENFTISLNVTANEVVDTWTYTLVKMSDNSTIYDNITFTPNTTFNAVRRSNKLIVWANNTAGVNYTSEVIFYVSVENTAPIIQEIPHLLACEDSYFSYFFNVTDLDEDTIYLYLQPLNPFYIQKNFSEGNLTIGEIYSILLAKQYAGIHRETIWVVDSQYADSKLINITVIEVNHPPSVENLTTQTTWVNDTFYYQVNVTDLEDGNSSQGNMTFNLTFLSGAQFFDINTSTGVINITPNISHVGVYNISICVSDQGLINPHLNLSLCNETNDSETACENFSLTITSENRAPVISSHYPESLALTVYEGEIINFSITKYDPDGTIPDTYWYLDEILTLSFEDEYNYTASGGSHRVTAFVTDGELNASLTWNITVISHVTPPQVPPSGGGGGAVKKPKCEELWACDEWGACQGLEAAYTSKLIDLEIKELIEKTCLSALWKIDECGFQIRQCKDIHECNATTNKPAEIQACQFVKLAGCFDNVLNCHDGSCEILVDCGGPCPPCPTCSDGKQNQKEEGIDCGGPCPWPCPEEAGLTLEKFIRYLLILTILLLIAIILIRAIRILAIGRKRSNIYLCKKCEFEWQVSHGEKKPKECPKCRSRNIRKE